MKIFPIALFPTLTLLFACSQEAPAPPPETQTEPESPTAAATAPVPAPRAAETTVLGPFTGLGAQLHPDNLEPHPVNYVGTDLGFSYVHGGRLHFLFGDTWTTPGGLPAGAEPRELDDMYAWIDEADWPDPASVSSTNIPLLRLGQDPDSSELLFIDPGHVMDGLKTPEAGFSSGEREFAILILSKPQACTTDAECGTELTCDTGLGYFGVLSTQQQGLTLACMEGSANCIADTMMGEAGEPVPDSGFCVDRTSSAWADTAAGRVSSLAFLQRIGLRDEAEPWRYHTVEDWLTTKFINTTTRTVHRFDPATSAAHRGRDYRNPGDASPEQRVLLWGRPGFIGVNATGRPMNLYFAWADLPRAPDFDWKLHYFTGVDAAGVPQFSEREREAAAVDLDSETPDHQPTEINDLIQHMSVAWIERLNKWVMLYGGGIVMTPIPAFGWSECGILEIFVPEECRQIAYGDGAIYLRTADDPWGPWSPPQKVIAGGDPEVPGSGQYGPGGMLFHFTCSDPTCAPSTAVLPDLRERGYGWLYGANIIEPWTRPAGNGVDILWNASTWDPYRVILLRTRIEP